MKCPDFYKLIISHTAGKCKPVCIFLSAPPDAFAIRPAARVCRPPGAFATPPGAFPIRPARHAFAARPALLPSVPPSAFAIRPARRFAIRPALLPSVPPGAFVAQPRPARLPSIPSGALCHPTPRGVLAVRTIRRALPPAPPDALYRPARRVCLHEKTPEQSVLCSGVVEATPGIEPGNEDFADPCLTAWLCRRGWSGRRGSNPPPQPWQGCALPNELLPQIRRHGGGIGTPSGARTLDTLIKSQVLYQLS